MTYVSEDTIHEREVTRGTSSALPVWGTETDARRGHSQRLLERLGFVALAAPMLALLLAVARAPGPVSLTIAMLWASAQPLLVAWLLRRRRLRLQEELPTLGDLVELGSRAEAAEAALRKDEEMLHELRATVIGITMAHQLLKTSSPEIHDATRDRLTELQDSELARLERLIVGVPERTADHVDLRDVVRPIADSLRLRGTTIECHGDAAATGRPDDISEIIHILLANAARHAPGSEIRVTVFQTSTAAGIQVSDKGPGVPQRLASRVFERGLRGPGSPGHGLGLHIARNLAREMGGELRLEPTTNGASFELTLPLAVGVGSCLAHSA
jgi:signal transduction histidine kinase